MSGHAISLIRLTGGGTLRRNRYPAQLLKCKPVAVKDGMASSCWKVRILDLTADGIIRFKCQTLSNKGWK